MAVMVAVGVPVSGPSCMASTNTSSAYPKLELSLAIQSFVDFNDDFAIFYSLSGNTFPVNWQNALHHVLKVD
jgi:hypothetical protein